MICPRCSHENPSSALFCASCGASLVPGTLVPTPPPAPSHDSPTSVLTPGSGGGRIGAGTPLESFTPGARLGQRYEIRAILGQGGMGVVYRARDLKLDRDVALKVIRPELLDHPGVLERFHREILLASQVTHKHILRIHDLGESDGLSFISMQYVEGVTLSERLEREGPMPPDEAVAMAIQLCHALQAAHDAGVVHRDLKPQNVLIDKDGNTYIADFGISRSVESGRTMTEQGAVIGTMDYMSPEQARGETTDHRGDIYSMGMVLYQMLTGQLPFSGLSSITAVVRRAQEEVPDPRRSRADIPLWLARVVSRALRRDPAERYQRADDLARDLASQAAPKLWKRVLKPRFLARAGAVVLGLALLGAGIAAGARYLLARREGAPVAVRASLALVPFANGTGDAKYDWIRAGLPDLLRTDLLQSRELRLAGADRVGGILSGMKLGDELRPDSVQLVANLVGAENVLTGTLRKSGDRFRLEATLQRIVGSSIGGATPIRVEGTGDAALFSMVDELSRHVRDGLDLSRRWGEKDRKVSDLSTGSVEALQLYTEAESAARAGNDAKATELLEHTVETDPEFAVARAALAETYARRGYADKASSAAARAAQSLRPGTSPAESARIRGIKARLDHDLAAAVAAYRELVEITPNDGGAQVELASVLEQKGDLPAARDTLRRLAALDARDANAHQTLGRIELKLGNAEEALRELNTALQIHVEARNDEGRAAVLNAIGNAHYLRSDYVQAQRFYQEALEIRKSIGDKRGERVSLNNIAVLQREQGNFEEAVGTAEQALALSREIKDEAGEADTQATLGDIYDQAGRPEKARESYQSSLRLAQEVNDEAVLSRDLANLGYINSVLGNYTEALVFLKEALDKQRAIGAKPNILRSLIDLGGVEQIQGRYEDALKHYAEALTLAQDVGEKSALVVLKENLADIRKDQGDYAAALELLGEGAALAKEIGDQGHEATALAYKGSALTRAGDRAGAAQALEEAAKLARASDDQALTAEILAYRGELLASDGDSGGAQGVLRQAVALADKVQNRRLVLLARSAAAQTTRSPREIEAVLVELEKVGLTPLAVQARASLARVLLGAGDAARAQREAERAIDAAKPLRANDVLFQSHCVAAGALARLGRHAEAAEHYAGALGAWTEMRRGLPAPAAAHLAARPDVAAFARAAAETFGKVGRVTEAELLRTALAAERS